MVCVWVYMQKVELRHLLEYGDEKTAINQLNEKRSLIPWGLRVPIWNINFCSSVLRLSELPRFKERPQTAICCLERLGRLRCLATWFGCVLVISFHVVKVFSDSRKEMTRTHPNQVGGKVLLCVLCSFCCVCDPKPKGEQ